MASMQALFFTLSVACFIKARLLSGKKTRSAIIFYFLCALAALCSFLSKENSAVLPVALALTDIWFFDSAWLKKAWAVCRKTGWKVRAAAAAALLSSSFYAFAVVLPKLLSGYAQRDFNLVQRLLTEGRVVVWYMSLLLWPAPARLSMEHDPQISTSLFSPFTTFPALLLIARPHFSRRQVPKAISSDHVRDCLVLSESCYRIDNHPPGTCLRTQAVPAFDRFLSIRCGAFCDSFPEGRQPAPGGRISQRPPAHCFSLAQRALPS